MPSDHAFMKCLKAIFFLGYFEYFKPQPVHCLNKLWHWAILTLFSNHWLHIDAPCVWRGGISTEYTLTWTIHRGTKSSCLVGAYSSGVVGTSTAEKQMKYVEDLKRMLVNQNPNRVDNTTQRASVKCLANSNLMYCQRRDETKFE